MALITDAFKKTYADSLQLALQQADSRLSPHVTVRTDLRGEGLQPAKYVEPFDFQDKASRFAPTPTFEPDFSTRWVAPVTKHVAPRIDRTDRLSLGFDPQSDIMQAIRAAARRVKDDVIIPALGGTNYTGKDGSTATALPASQVVDTNVGGSGTNLNKAKLLAALEILEANDVDPDAPRVLVIGPSQHAALRKLAELTDARSKISAEIVDGRVRSVFGTPVVVTNRLPVAVGVRDCFLFTRDGVFLGIWEDVFTDVQYDIANSWAIVMYAEVTLGATRLDEKKVVKIQCTE